jgi:hypothetical protein
VKLPIPKGIQRRLQPVQERVEAFLRGWEWTWTNAWIAGVVISFIAMTTLVVIPSWFLYFAEQELGWDQSNRMLLTIRDLVVLGWLNVWGVIFVVTAYKVQVIRRKLRGERQAERYSGGYR